MSQTRQNDDHAEATFLDLGFKAMGVWGKYSVVFFVLLEFVGALIVSLIFLYRNSAVLVDTVLQVKVGGVGEPNMLWIAAACTLVLCPTVCYLDFSRLTFLSVIGVISNTSICICAIGIAIHSATSGCDTLPKVRLLLSFF